MFCFSEMCSTGTILIFLFVVGERLRTRRPRQILLIPGHHGL